jgi:citrate lyase beta subunit
MNRNHQVPPRRRSCLSVPASSERMLAKAAGLPADEVVIDLEDAVAEGAQGEARAAAARPLSGSCARRLSTRLRAPTHTALAAGALQSQSGQRDLPYVSYSDSSIVDEQCTRRPPPD